MLCGTDTSKRTEVTHALVRCMFLFVFLAKETRVLMLELLCEPIFSYFYNVPHCLQTLQYYQGTLCICKMNDSVGVLHVTP